MDANKLTMAEGNRMTHGGASYEDEMEGCWGIQGSSMGANLLWSGQRQGRMGQAGKVGVGAKEVGHGQGGGLNRRVCCTGI